MSDHFDSADGKTQYEPKDLSHRIVHKEPYNAHVTEPLVHQEPPKAVHARFRLAEDGRIVCHQSKKDGKGWEQVNGIRVKLYPVQGEPFGSATPSGEINMIIVNPEAIKVFSEAELGQEYDVIFTPVKKAQN